MTTKIDQGAIASTLRKLAVKGGPTSFAARLKDDSINPFASWVSNERPDAVSEAEVANALYDFAERFPATIAAEPQRRGTSTDKIPGLTGEMLSHLSPEQKINFANTGQLPPPALRRKVK